MERYTAWHSKPHLLKKKMILWTKKTTYLLHQKQIQLETTQQSLSAQSLFCFRGLNGQEVPSPLVAYTHALKEKVTWVAALVVKCHFTSENSRVYLVHNKPNTFSTSSVSRFSPIDKYNMLFVHKMHHSLQQNSSRSHVNSNISKSSVLRF